jgi:hypothetical protein
MAAVASMAAYCFDVLAHALAPDRFPPPTASQPDFANDSL